MKGSRRQLVALLPLPAASAAALTLALFAAPLAARAADLKALNNAVRIASGVGAGTAVPSLGIGAVLQTIVGLAVVVGLVFGCAWLARRFGLQPSARGNIVRVVGGASLGGKERVAVVEIGDTWLVLGAAPGNVRLLHTLPAGSVHPATLQGKGDPGAGAGDGDGGAGEDARQTSFGTRFRAALANEAKKRFSRPPGGGN